MSKEHWSLIATACDSSENLSFGARMAYIGMGLIFDPVTAISKGLEKLGIDNPPANLDANDPTSTLNDYP